MKIYIAAPVPDRGWAQDIQKLCETHGFEVVSSWVTDEETGYEKGGLAQKALRDMDELQVADTLIAYCVNPGDSGGGMHSEIGAALALGKLVVIIDKRSGVLTYHPNVYRVANIQDALTFLVLYPFVQVAKQIRDDEQRNSLTAQQFYAAHVRSGHLIE